MEFKDIVNRDIVNLTNCDQEPIHIPGSIQPHGFLIAIDPLTQQVSFCSQNIKTYTGIDYTGLLGQPVNKLFSKEQVDDLIKKASGEDFLNARSVIIHTGKNSFECNAHFSDKWLVVEGETLNQDEHQTDLNAQAGRFLYYMEGSHTLVELCDHVAKGIREITGYDRVMIYRFDEEYNGEVVAESKKEELESFLGLHYPHTDIPAQARELYLKNLIRLIVDINYTPVPVYTVNDGSNKNLDMSLCVLRSTSPIHVQYLHNMGVGATLTISLINEKKLWGLVACHHYSEKYIGYNTRLAAKLQGHFITSQINIRQKNEENQYAMATSKALEKLTQYTSVNSVDFFAEVMNHPEMLSICNATSAAIILNGKVYKTGVPLSDDIYLQLAAYYAGNNWQENMLTTSISAHVPGMMEHAATIAGVNCHWLGMGTDCVMWIRPETITEVNWAGDPQKAIVKDEKGLSPRRSFEQWSEKVKYKSFPWREPELNCCASFADVLQKQMHLIRLAEEEKMQRQLSESLKQTNAELENINWISMHDLQEPLRKIQMSASRILDTENTSPEQIHKFVSKMNESAGRMQNLLKELQQYAGVKEMKQEMQDVDLNDLLKEVMADMELHSQASLNIGTLPVVKGVKVLLRQLLVNILSNAVKFADKRRPLEINISSEDIFEGPHQPPAYTCVDIKDNGIGFDPLYNEKIFEIFARLNLSTEYEGAGMGLSLCRKIMKLHGGNLLAGGAKGKGASFFLYFPANEV